MNYQHNHYQFEQFESSLQDLELGALASEQILGLQICGELLVESRHVVLGALAWKGWIEHGRCLVIVNLPDATNFSQAIDLPMGIMVQNDPLMKIVDAEQMVKEYDPLSEGVLAVSYWDKNYCIASTCIFNPGFPPQVCYQEVAKRPSEFDFAWAA